MKGRESGMPEETIGRVSSTPMALSKHCSMLLVSQVIACLTFQRQAITWPGVLDLVQFATLQPAFLVVHLGLDHVPHAVILRESAFRLGRVRPGQRIDL
ncbi:hypothetical protein [Pseudomonas sp. R5(2019)]|uniref:hypothetical protein n=1 Tax=Pseudomonas sp. R5(2019) TaxID=2697566 RepID=UPI001412A6A7|nr:hypothetical protein [Pseudomonas sp. R5(2019)]NBA95221.1 hypothetical protein [Pseudomonas sp. R5(2019)]